SNNFDTTYTECLHIDLAKDAYASTNHKDEFTQMTMWLECKEKIFHHEQHLKWQQDGSPTLRPQIEWQPPSLELDHCLHMMKHPTVQAVPVDRLVEVYGATYFCPVLAHFIALTNELTLTHVQLEAKLRSICMPFCCKPGLHHLMTLVCMWTLYTTRYRQSFILPFPHLLASLITLLLYNLASNYMTLSCYIVCLVVSSSIS
ncbi:hypothetical protein L208DRAFT_1307204, partial [Tricholoma matsutake]